MSARRPSSKQQDRRRRITELVMDEGTLRIDDLVATVGASSMTVYRDLADLESQGLVHRNRGYVTAASSLLYEAASEYRLQQNEQEKQEIAAAAAELVEPGQALVLDDSTTGVHLARLLPERAPLTVVTNHRGVFAELANQQGIHLICVGGDFLPWADAFVGGMALDALRGMRVDLAIMSVSAVTDGICFYPQQEMVQLKKAMLASARRKVLYVDHTKFRRRALHAVAPAEDFDTVIVDSRTPDDEIAVLREYDGRGGSVEFHELVAPGVALCVGWPRNNFELHPAGSYLFLAGGIGVTPLLPMVEAAERAGADWRMAYGARERSRLSFVDRLRSYAPGRVELWPEDERGRPDFAAELAGTAPDALVYACGPGGMLDAVSAAHAGSPAERGLHIERFSADGPVDVTGEEIEVVLARSGRTILVPGDRSVLSAVREVLPKVPYSCEEGYCGECETGLLQGEPDHRDTYLTDEERESGETMMLCVSRCAGRRLVLDL